MYNITKSAVAVVPASAVVAVDTKVILTGSPVREPVTKEIIAIPEPPAPEVPCVALLAAAAPPPLPVLAPAAPPIFAFVPGAPAFLAEAPPAPAVLWLCPHPPPPPIPPA